MTAKLCNGDCLPDKDKVEDFKTTDRWSSKPVSFFFIIIFKKTSPPLDLKL